MNVDEMKVGELKQIISMLGAGSSTDCPGPWKVGDKYLIRTVTNYQTGRLVAVYPQELVLEDAAWIPDTGRFGNALNEGVLEEVEPIPQGTAIVSRGAISDAVLWCHELPRSQK